MLSYRFHQILDPQQRHVDDRRKWQPHSGSPQEYAQIPEPQQATVAGNMLPADEPIYSPHSLSGTYQTYRNHQQSLWNAYLESLSCFLICLRPSSAKKVNSEYRNSHSRLFLKHSWKT